MFTDRLHHSWHRLETAALEFNLFGDESARDDHRHRSEIISTRIYIFLITLSVTILIICMSTDIQTQHITVYNPSQETFEQLLSSSKYSSTIDCPCRNISILYGTFVSASYQFHQFCSSDFVIKSSLWMSLIYSRFAGLNYSYDDFRVFIVPQFRSLTSLCTVANVSVVDAWTQFISNALVTDRAQSRETIEAKANASLAQFRSSTSRTFVRLLDYFRSVTQGNGIVSSTTSNWHFLSLDTSRSWVSLWSEPRSYGDKYCSCGTSAMCASPAAIDGWRVPGFLVGCYPYEALFQSTLECLYDVMCINRLKEMYHPSNITIRPLNPNLSNPNASVQSLINTLLIDRWQSNVIYERYYAACAPLSCSYSIEERPAPLYILSTIIGLYGGLSVAFKLFIPVSVRIGRHLITRHRPQVQPAVAMIATQE